MIAIHTHRTLVRHILVAFVGDLENEDRFPLSDRVSLCLANEQRPRVHAFSVQQLSVRVVAVAFVVAVRFWRDSRPSSRFPFFSFFICLPHRLARTDER